MASGVVADGGGACRPMQKSLPAPRSSTMREVCGAAAMIPVNSSAMASVIALPASGRLMVTRKMPPSCLLKIVSLIDALRLTAPRLRYRAAILPIPARRATRLRVATAHVMLQMTRKDRRREDEMADTAKIEGPDAEWMRRLAAARGLGRAQALFPDTV